MVRFLADENFDQRITLGLRRNAPALDIQTAREAGLLGMPDPAVLAYAADENRVVLSHDTSTLPGHLATFLMSGRHSPGVLLVPQESALGRTISDLLLVWEASTADEWRDTWTRLPL
ncbi:MAG: DUF5615 family PIN-like protein [Ktedonobacterales bacterium]|nr:DUF5615 family PIN-like protein [Ktedonobacterales bacterium]